MPKNLKTLALYFTGAILLGALTILGISFFIDNVAGIDNNIAKNVPIELIVLVIPFSILLTSIEKDQPEDSTYKSRLGATKKILTLVFILTLIALLGAWLYVYLFEYPYGRLVN